MQHIKQTKKESVLTNQLIRSGTSVSANIHESFYGHGTADFIAKLQIALKECSESEYWLKLLFSNNSIDEETFKKYRNLCGRIQRMLTSSCITIAKRIDQK